MQNVHLKISTNIYLDFRYLCPDFTYDRITVTCNCMYAICDAFPGAFRVMQRVACDTNGGFQTSDLPRFIQVWGT